jgi:peroxiredoxin Q/BCP
MIPDIDFDQNRMGDCGMFVRSRNAALAACAVASLMMVGGVARAQQLAASAPVVAPGPAVNDLAPDFTLAGATRYGVLKAPIKLSDYRGRTVVVAFFPKARTSGCTVQMEAYRDQYATLFNNGRNVVVIGISVDPDTTLASWARDEEFPQSFASDQDGSVGQLYGTYDPKNKIENRFLYVVRPDGRIAYVSKPFKVLTPSSYTDLAAIVDGLAPPPKPVATK